MTFFRKTDFIRKKEAEEHEKRRSHIDLEFLRAYLKVMLGLSEEEIASRIADHKNASYEEKEFFFTSHSPRMQFPGSPIRYTWMPLSPFPPEPPVLEMNHLIRSLKGLVSAEIGLGYRTGWLIAEIPLDADGKHIFEIESVLRALREGGLPGRPKGQPKPKKSGRPPNPPSLAIKVHQAKLDGMNTEQIARRVLKEPWPADKKARNRLRAYVNRLNSRGARLLAKKS